MSTPTTQSATFSITPEAILDRARDLFVSENFSQAIAILRENFGDEARIDLILSLLKGELRIQSLSDNELAIVETDLDEEYRTLAREVLENYDFIHTIDDSLFQVLSALDFNINSIESSDETILKLKNGELVKCTESQLFTGTGVFESDFTATGFFSNASYILYIDKQLVSFAPYKRSLIKEIMTTYDNAQDAARAYIRAWS